MEIVQNDGSGASAKIFPHHTLKIDDKYHRPLLGFMRVYDSDGPCPAMESSSSTSETAQGIVQQCQQLAAPISHGYQFSRVVNALAALWHFAPAGHVTEEYDGKSLTVQQQGAGYKNM